MAQFDVHRNTGNHTDSIPFVVVVQSAQFDDYRRRVVVPLVRSTAIGKVSFAKAGIKAGAIFVRVHGAASVGESLTAQNVSAVLRKVGKWIGLEREEWERVSGHSARVGAAQDLLALNIDVASVMQAGRWKDTRMPMRYAEKVLASRGAMARAAKAQGRA
jgi:hypothetical protein